MPTGTTELQEARAYKKAALYDVQGFINDKEFPEI